MKSTISKRLVALCMALLEGTKRQRRAGGRVPHPPALHFIYRKGEP